MPPPMPPQTGGMLAFFSTIPKNVWVPIIITYACLLPREMTVNLAGASLFPYRACLFIFLPFAIGQLKYVRKLSIVDFFAVFTALWHVIALLVTESAATAFIRGGAQGADFGLAYLIGRTTFRSPNDFRIYFLALIPGLCATALVMAVESVSGRLILRPLIADLFGQARPERLFEQARMGLFRASGPFPHPILGGVFLAAILPLAWYLPRGMPMMLLAVATSLGCIFTVSSTAVLALGLSAIIMGMRWAQNVTRLPVFPTVIAYLFLGYAALSIVSDSGPMSIVTRYLLFDPSSSYFRQLIWDYATIEVVNHPFFGIGLREWIRPKWMPISVDSYWLTSAMHLGLPLAIGAFMTLAGAIVALVRHCSHAPLSVRDIAFSIGTALAVIIFSGFSVHLWEGVAAWMLIIAGFAVTLSQWARNFVRVPHPPRQEALRHRPHAQPVRVPVSPRNSGRR